ncbi:MAG: ATP-binding protein [Pseudomonadota bacterium]|nr:ATP-binding protein [Pseudomonadota bacterium]
MRPINGLWHSIFLRIYAGLILVCALVGIFAYVLVQSINAQRAQNYREEMASGAFYLITQGIARQPDAISRQHWLNDASILLNTPLSLIQMAGFELSRHEREQLLTDKAVVRYHPEKEYADVYAKLPNDETLLYARIDRLGEQQIKAMATFLLDDLVSYPDQAQRLEALQTHFSFPVDIKLLDSLDLDLDQIRRIRRSDTVVVFSDSATSTGSSIQIVNPVSNTEVLVLGPIPLFNWLPFRLFAGITLLSLFLISLGVYTLIFPLERKLRQVQIGVRQVRAGDFSTRVPVTGRDEVAHLASMFNNMTEHIQRLIEAQRELTRAVSHELRTPVARIRFGVDMLADTDDEASRWEQQAHIDKDIESLNSLIDEILTYAKLEEGTPSLNLETIGLADMLQQIADETRGLGRPIEVEVALPEAEVSAIAERRYLHRVLQNLAGNASRYADSRIRISAGVEGQEAFVCVEDDGAGIPEKDREKIFLPFARLDDSRTRASGGYGLGLSIVSRIAFWFGGQMLVDESPTLGGARFIMRWPIQPPKN